MTEKNDRIKRAEEQGFDTSTIWYHVTDTNIKAFDIDKTNDSCIWLTNNLEDAKNGVIGASVSIKDAIIIPLYISAKNLAGWNEEDSLTTDQIINAGFDGCLLDDDVKLFHPHQIRSIHDDFLEKNINSNILNHTNNDIIDILIKKNNKIKQKKRNKKTI